MKEQGWVVVTALASHQCVPNLMLRLTHHMWDEFADSLSTLLQRVFLQELWFPCFLKIQYNLILFDFS